MIQETVVGPAPIEGNFEWQGYVVRVYRGTYITGEPQLTAELIEHVENGRRLEIPDSVSDPFYEVVNDLEWSMGFDLSNDNLRAFAQELFNQLHKEN